MHAAGSGGGAYVLALASRRVCTCARKGIPRHASAEGRTAACVRHAPPPARSTSRTYDQVQRKLLCPNLDETVTIDAYASCSG
jgi:hypothetical protein